MKKMFAILALVGVMATPAVMHADQFYGTLGFYYTNLSINPTTTGGSATNLYPVSGINFINYTGILYDGNSSPLFPTILAGSGGISAGLLPMIYPNSPTDGANSSTPYTLQFSNYGTFVTTSSINYINLATPETLDMYLTGTWTPGSVYPGFTGGPANVVLAFTESLSNGGVSYSGSGTLSVAAAPEPSGLILLGTGLLGAVITMRRRLV